MTTVKSPLSNEAKKTAGDCLQGVLVDLLDLTLQAKQAHWNLTGRHFRSIHLQLDDVVATTRKYSDLVAERAVAIGVNPDGRAHTVADRTKLPQLETGWVQDDKAVAAMVDRLGALISQVREGIKATEEADLVTQDLLIEIAHELEKHHWMFQVAI